MLNDSSPTEYPAFASSVPVYERLGSIIRALHDTLTELGADAILSEAATEFPSARERLNHIGTMTERAANTVLSKVEESVPIQHQIAKSAEKLLQQWDGAALENLSGEALAVLAGETRAFISATQAGSATVQHALSDIMMAQDFQDLTGQLIKKVVNLIERTETELLQLLIGAAPPGALPTHKKNELLSGPGAVGGVLLDQGNVDDLLADLGF